MPDTGSETSILLSEVKSLLLKKMRTAQLANEAPFRGTDPLAR